MIVAANFFVRTIATNVYLEAQSKADAQGDRNGKSSLDELNNFLMNLNQQAQVSRFTPEGQQAHQNLTDATQVMIDHFGVFANNRGLPPGSIMTQEFRVDEDDQIRPEEIRSVATGDGKPQDISNQDINGPFNPQQPPVYEPPVYQPPVYRPPVYRPPVYGGGGQYGGYQSIFQQILRVLQSLYNQNPFSGFGGYGRGGGYQPPRGWY